MEGYVPEVFFDSCDPFGFVHASAEVGFSSYDDVEECVDVVGEVVPVANAFYTSEVYGEAVVEVAVGAGIFAEDVAGADRGQVHDGAA